MDGAQTLHLAVKGRAGTRDACEASFFCVLNRLFLAPVFLIFPVFLLIFYPCLAVVGSWNRVEQARPLRVPDRNPNHARPRGEL